MNAFIIAPLLFDFCHSDRRQRKGRKRPADLDSFLNWTPLLGVLWFFSGPAETAELKEIGKLLNAGHGGTHL